VLQNTVGMEDWVMTSSNLFITGCDKTTEWMLPWFIHNFKKHNTTPLKIFDFGMTNDMKSNIRSLPKSSPSDRKMIVSMKDVQSRGWYKKPESMYRASGMAEKVCWIDTDCHVLDNIDDIFDYTVPQKLGMVEDKPWTMRTGGKFHNSGVVVFEGTPPILDQWRKKVAEKNREIAVGMGDQEVLHAMMDSPLTRHIHITDVPNEYNWLRLQVEVDNQNSYNKKIMHWTGLKGKERIKKYIEEWNG